MGYYSDVLMVVQGPPKLIKCQLAKLALIEPWFRLIEVEVINGELEISLERGIIKFECNCKFYDDFADVRAIRLLYKHFEELYDSSKAAELDAPEEQQFDAIEGILYRSGEDLNDIEVNAFGNGNRNLGEIYVSITTDIYIDNDFGSGRAFDERSCEARDTIPVLRGAGDATPSSGNAGDSNSSS